MGKQATEKTLRLKRQAEAKGEPHCDSFVMYVRDQWIDAHGDQPVKGAIALQIEVKTEIPLSVTKAIRNKMLYCGHVQWPQVINFADPIVEALAGVAFTSRNHVEELSVTKIWTMEGNGQINISVRPLYESIRKLPKIPRK